MMWIVQAEPRPITCARPTFAPCTCRAPACSRRCQTTSTMFATPVAPSGGPFDNKGPLPPRPARRRAGTPPADAGLALIDHPAGLAVRAQPQVFVVEELRGGEA